MLYGQACLKINCLSLSLSLSVLLYFNTELFSKVFFNSEPIFQGLVMNIPAQTPETG